MGGPVYASILDRSRPDVVDGLHDAISLIGMFAHVGLRNLGAYFDQLYALLRPGGRLLEPRDRAPGASGEGAHAHSDPAAELHRPLHVPDGELHELDAVISRMQPRRSRFAKWTASASTTH
jgi:cyclopropane-fatty-acyl-phospholipid synthase